MNSQSASPASAAPSGPSDRLSLSPGARYRWAIASRALAATVGAYALTSLIVLAIALLAKPLGLNQARTLHAATVGSFLLYGFLILVAFHTRSATRAWLLLLVLSVVPGAIVLFAR